MMYEHWYPSGYAGVYGLGFVFNILFWIALVFFVVFLFRMIFGKGDTMHSRLDLGNKNTYDAMSILKSRYAKGEINKKEFEEIRKEISK